MKKMTLLFTLCCMAALSYATGGDITYNLNGGVTNDYGWVNKSDMFTAFATEQNPSFEWKTLEYYMSQANPLSSPNICSGLTSCAILVNNSEKWGWLKTYVQTVSNTQRKSDPDITNLDEFCTSANWRYAVGAFFAGIQNTGWPKSADFTLAGQPDAFMPTWGKGFAGPSTYDGTTAVAIPNPYKEGYIFGGWYESADFSGEKTTAIAEGRDGNVTLHAKWLDYLPCADVWALASNTSVKAGGVVTYVNGTDVYIQDANAGLLVEFTTAPSVVAGQAITLNGTTALVGNNYVKVTDATLLTTETGTLPTAQTVAIPTLSSNAASYMFELVYVQGLKIAANDGINATLQDDAGNSILLAIAISPTEFPVNTRVNVTAVVSYGTELMLMGTADGIVKAPSASADPFTYPSRDEGKYTLENKWLVSVNMDNYSSNKPGNANYVRGMAAKDGKMYFIDRELKQLTVVDGTTGEKLAPIVLASNIFTYTGRNSANTADSTYVAGTLPFNDIKIDAAGNILLGNCITSNVGVFQIWKIDLATGAGTLVLQERLADTPDYAENTNIRFDAFGVYGDVNNNGYIIAANSNAFEAYKWPITNGTVGEVEAVLIDVSNANSGLSGLSPSSWAAQVYPIDDNLFFIDYFGTYPSLIDMEGNYVDGFYNKDNGNTFPVLIDNITNPGSSWSMATGHNGLVEFEIGEEYFLLIASSNTATAPPSSFRLFKYADANREFKDLEILWTFPAAGMGAATNAYRTAVPSVEVNETTGTANLYLYAGENGYGVYEFKVSNGSGINNIHKNSALNIYVKNNTLTLSEEVASVVVYSVSGQTIYKAEKVASFDVPRNGMFVVKAVTYDGKTTAKKVVIK